MIRKMTQEQLEKNIQTLNEAVRSEGLGQEKDGAVKTNVKAVNSSVDRAVKEHFGMDKDEFVATTLISTAENDDVCEHNKMLSAFAMLLAITQQRIERERMTKKFEGGIQ